MPASVVSPAAAREVDAEMPELEDSLGPLGAVAELLHFAPARPPVDLRFLSFPRLCSATLVNRLASLPRVPVFQRQVFDPGGPSPSFSHIILFLRPWLLRPEKAALRACGREWRWWEQYGDSPISPPHPVIRNRLRGFGVRSPLICSRHSVVAAWGPFHHAWSFLAWSDRAALVSAFPVALQPYALLRRAALSLSVAPLRLPRPAPTGEPIDALRSQLLACALLRFDFHHGDLIRWLGGGVH